MPVRCSVADCPNLAAHEVVLFDVYSDGTVFFEQEHTCPFLCEGHTAENEEGAYGERRPRGSVRYPFTNKHKAQGFTVYRPLKEPVEVEA